MARPGGRHRIAPGLTRSRSRWLALLGGSLAVLVAVPAGWAFLRPGTQASEGSAAESLGSRPALFPAPAPSPASPVPPSPAAPSTAGPDIPRIGIEVPAPPDLPLPALPVRLELPSVGVDASIAPTGVRDDGQVDVPRDARSIGWYEASVRPGWPQGSAVLVGHVDSREQGRGAMYPLRGVQLGAEVAVTRADGSRLAYRVVSRESIDKAVLPTSDLFAAIGPERLTLITCGGAYRPEAGGYQQNVVVTAVPA